MVYRVALSGSHGLIGSALASALKSKGHQVFCLTRKKSALPSDIFYDYRHGIIDKDRLCSMDVIIHLAGRPIMDARWNEEIKREIWDSRVESTKLIANALAQCEIGPKVFLCASAAGIYGNCGNEILDESHKPGQDFLAKLCVAWEEASARANGGQIRVVNTRFGHVLSKDGGFLAKLLPLFRLGLGVKMGSGKQYLSFIAIHDLVSAIIFLIEHQAISGPVNCSVPEPVTNADFTRTLAKALGRPAFFSAPEAFLKLALGEASEALLDSCRMTPKVLLQNGFAFRTPTLKEALAKLLS